MFCAVTYPAPDEATDFGEMFPVITFASFSRALSDGLPSLPTAGRAGSARVVAAFGSALTRAAAELVAESTTARASSVPRRKAAHPSAALTASAIAATSARRRRTSRRLFCARRARLSKLDPSRGGLTAEKR